VPRGLLVARARIAGRRAGGGNEMTWHSTLIALLLSGFFAVACLKASVAGGPAAGSAPSALDMFRLPGRLERFRRSRWQWVAMVSLMIVLRLQQQLPLSLELMAALELVVFLLLPARGARARGDAAVV
jgi:hypothetical protein